MVFSVIFTYIMHYDHRASYFNEFECNILFERENKSFLICDFGFCGIRYFLHVGARFHHLCRVKTAEKEEKTRN